MKKAYIKPSLHSHALQLEVIMVKGSLDDDDEFDWRSKGNGRIIDDEAEEEL